MEPNNYIGQRVVMDSSTSSGTIMGTIVGETNYFYDLSYCIKYNVSLSELEEYDPETDTNVTALQIADRRVNKQNIEQIVLASDIPGLPVLKSQQKGDKK